MPEMLPNLRDVGGLPADGGHHVRAGRLLRSAVPLPDDIVPGSVAWPPTTVVDLRSTEEMQASHPLQATGAVVHHVPLLASLHPGVAPPEELHDLYLQMLDTVPDHLVTIVDVVADSAGPALVHCFAGKDRTGISIAFLLRLVGVARADVIADYLRTRDNEAQIEARFRRVNGSRRRQLPASYFTTRQDAIEAVLDRWDADPDGTVGWYLGAGGSVETLQRLLQSLLD